MPRPRPATIDEQVARKLHKFLNTFGHNVSPYVQVIFHPTHSLEEDKKVDATMIENSRPLVRFTYTEARIQEMREKFPEGVMPYSEGYIMLYVPPRMIRFREAVSVGPTYEEMKAFRWAVKCFMAGFEAAQK